jgi:hypothetical protein
MIVNLYSNSCTEMVPVLSETGSLMAYVLYPDSTGILQELYGCKAISRLFSGNTQAIPRQSNSHSSSTQGDTTAPIHEACDLLF